MSIYEGFLQTYRPNSGDASKPTFDPDTTRLYLGLKRSVDAMEKDVRGQVSKQKENALNRNIKLQTAMAQVRSREFTAQEALSGRLQDTIRSDALRFRDSYNGYNQNTVANINNAIGRSGLVGRSREESLLQAIGQTISGDPEGIGRDALTRAATLRQLLKDNDSQAIVQRPDGRYELGPIMKGLDSGTQDAINVHVKTMNEAERLKAEMSDYVLATEKLTEDVANKRSGATAGLNQLGEQYKAFSEDVMASGPSAEDSQAALGQIEFAREKYAEDEALLDIIQKSLMGGEPSKAEVLRAWAKEPGVAEWVADRNFKPAPFVVKDNGRVIINQNAAKRAYYKYAREEGKPDKKYLARYGKGLTGDEGKLVITAEDGSTKEFYGDRLMAHATDASGTVALRYYDPETDEVKTTRFGPDEYTAWVGETVVPSDEPAFVKERIVKKHADLVRRYKNEGLTENQLDQVRAPWEAVEIDDTLYAVSNEGDDPEVLRLDDTGKFVTTSPEEASRVREAAAVDGRPFVNSKGELIDPMLISAGATIPDDIDDSVRDDVRDQVISAAGLENQALADTLVKVGDRTEARPLTTKRKTVADRISDVLEPRKSKAVKEAEAFTPPVSERAAEEAELAADIEASGEPDDLRELETPEEDRPEAADVAPTPAPEPAPEPEPAAIETAEEAVTAQATADEAAAATVAADQRSREQLIERLARAAVTNPNADTDAIREDIEAIRRGEEGAILKGSQTLTKELTAQDNKEAIQEAAQVFAANTPSPAEAPTLTAKERREAKERKDAAIDAEVIDVISGDTLTDDPAADVPDIPDQQYTGPTQRADEPAGVRKARERKTEREKRKAGGITKTLRSKLGIESKMDPATAALAANNIGTMGTMTPGQVGESPQAIKAVATKGSDIKLDDDDDSNRGVA
tara:strand:+ start:8287 stop:11043 length:2757 start_codon:yes stop_codon:yes gene_type:complete